MRWRQQTLSTWGWRRQRRHVTDIPHTNIQHARIVFIALLKFQFLSVFLRLFFAFGPSRRGWGGGGFTTSDRPPSPPARRGWCGAAAQAWPLGQSAMRPSRRGGGLGRCDLRPVGPAPFEEPLPPPQGGDLEPQGDWRTTRRQLNVEGGWEGFFGVASALGGNGNVIVGATAGCRGHERMKHVTTRPGGGGL